MITKKVLLTIIIFLIMVILLINQNKFEYVYETYFLNADDYDKLLNELKKYDAKLYDNHESNHIVQRYNLKLNSEIVKNIINKYTTKIKELTKNNNIYLANNFPIEYRSYQNGSFMKKHRDALVYKKPQYECILTLSNTTDSFTKIKNNDIRAEPNSIIILKALGVEHEVTKVTQGERKFLKFIFTETDEFA